ncbi:hypothetical protein Tco_1136158 [Tanacetum coccineum]
MASTKNMIISSIRWMSKLLFLNVISRRSPLSVQTEPNDMKTRIIHSRLISLREGSLRSKGRPPMGSKRIMRDDLKINEEVQSEVHSFPPLERREMEKDGPSKKPRKHCNINNRGRITLPSLDLCSNPLDSITSQRLRIFDFN